MLRCCHFLRLKAIPSPPSGVITKGCGEFIFAKKEDAGGFSPISTAEYKEIYPIIKGCIFRPPLEAVKESVRKRLGHRVCPIFIPNTLYGLYFVEECIQERVQILEETKKNLLSLAAATDQLRRLTSEESAKKMQLQKRAGFWPLCYYSTPDYVSDRIMDVNDARSSHLIEVGSLLNERIVTRLGSQLSSEGLSYEQIHNAAQRLIEFHSQMNDPKNPYFQRVLKAVQMEQGLGLRSFLSHFFYFSCYEFAVAIGNDPPTRRVVENSIRLECSPEVEDCVILYRGARSLNESLIGQNGRPLSFSLGSRLLAGCIHDAGAMALAYTGHPGRSMLAFVVAKEDLRKKETPFFVPEASSLEQFCSGGEGFHPRTLVPHEKVNETVFGSMFMQNKKYVGSSDSIQEIDQRFQRYLTQAIRL